MSDLAAQRRRPAQGDSHVLVAVDRAVGELRRGGAVLIEDRAGSAALALAAETAEPEALAALRGLAEGELVLAVTPSRAHALGLTGGDDRPALLPVDETTAAALLRRLADPTAAAVPGEAAGPRGSPIADGAELIPLASAAIELAKLARLLPAALVGRVAAPSDPGSFARNHDLLRVRVPDIALYRTLAARSLRPVSEAAVPLAGAPESRIVAFRPNDGGIEHLAIIIGRPAPDRPVLARLHSECFTGDLLGSLRCDCGDQLRGAIAEIARQGSGVLVYLAQEGRGIGLVNKLRAYQLQDDGADTLDANRQLGFDADERIYLPAAEMLRQLGFLSVRLMTNNPEKVAALTRCGITVAERVPHVFPANDHNERYLETKAARFGHLLSD
ncbi:MAG: GTP cyclohydrolase II [Dongiaceae bacterium]